MTGTATGLLLPCALLWARGARGNEVVVALAGAMVVAGGWLLRCAIATPPRAPGFGLVDLMTAAGFSALAALVVTLVARATGYQGALSWTERSGDGWGGDGWRRV